MRVKPPVYLGVLIFVLLGTAAWADQIILRNGTVYSGKFIRGDSQIVEFRVLGRVESFKTAEISQLVFKEPGLDASANAPAKTTESTPVQPSAAAAKPRTQIARRELPPESNPAASATSASTQSQQEPYPVEDRPGPQVVQRESPAQSSPESTLTIPAGMGMTVRTATDIDTDRNRVGDTFGAQLEDDLMSGTQVAAPRGSLVKGRIAYAQESGKLSGQSQLILELVEITIDGRKYPLSTSDYTQVGSSRGTRTAQTVGGTAALGAIIGAIAGGGKGAAIGAASGAAVGTGVQVITKGQVLRVPAETVLEFKLQHALTVDIR